MEHKNIGALWRKENAHGEYLIGHVLVEGKKHEVVLYPMPYSNGVKPDYIIEEGKKKEA